MLEFLAEYGMFFLKTLSLVFAFLAVFSGVVRILSRRKRIEKGKISVIELNSRLEEYKKTLLQYISLVYQ